MAHSVKKEGQTLFQSSQSKTAVFNPGSSCTFQHIMRHALCAIFPQSSISDFRTQKHSRIRLQKEWLCTHLRIFFRESGPLCRPGSIHDTDRISYRCFLPDLTRFVTACCVVSDQNGSGSPSIRPLGGSSAPHKADFGKRAPLTPRLAQPVTKIRHK